MVQRIAPIPMTKVNVVQPVRTKRAAPPNLFEAIGRAQAKRTKKIDSMLKKFKKYNANNTLWNENDITFLNNLNENDEKNLRARAKKYGVKLTYKTKDGRIKKRSVARLKELIAKKKNKASAFEALKSEARALGVPLTRVHPPSVKRTAMTANELQNAIRNVKANRQARANALAKKKANAAAAKKAKANALAQKKANAAAAKKAKANALAQKKANAAAAKKAKANALAKKKANALAAKEAAKANALAKKNDQYIKVAVSKMMDSIIKKNKRRKSRAQARANKAFVKKEVQGMFNRLKKMNSTTKKVNHMGEERTLPIKEAKKWNALMKLQNAIEKRYISQDAAMNNANNVMNKIEWPKTAKNRNTRYHPLMQKYYKTRNTYNNFIERFIGSDGVVNDGWRQKNLRVAETDAKLAMKMQNEIDNFTKYKTPQYSPKHRLAVQKLWNEYSRLNRNNYNSNNSTMTSV